MLPISSQCHKIPFENPVSFEEQIPISSENRRIIQNLLQELTQNSVAYLFWHAARLKEVGRKLRREVHPLSFLFVILKDPTLRGQMRKIYEERVSFLTGRDQIWRDFSRNLMRNLEKHAENLSLYLPFFAQELHLDSSILQAHCNARDWVGLLAFLNQSSPNCCKMFATRPLHPV